MKPVSESVVESTPGVKPDALALTSKVFKMAAPIYIANSVSLTLVFFTGYFSDNKAFF